MYPVGFIRGGGSVDVWCLWGKGVIELLMVVVLRVVWVLLTSGIYNGYTGVYAVLVYYMYSTYVENCKHIVFNAG